MRHLLEPAHCRVMDLLLEAPPFHRNHRLAFNFEYVTKKTGWSMYACERLLHDARIRTGIRTTKDMLEAWRLNATGEMLEAWHSNLALPAARRA